MDISKLSRFAEQFHSDGGRLDMNKWNYADGCVLTAAIELYRATGESKFRDYVLKYVDSFVLPDGSIRTYRQYEYKLDDIQPGRALLFAFSETKDERYMAAAKNLLKQLEDQPRTMSGNYWHKKIYPNQVWLDGLYMAQPFRMAYDTMYGNRGEYIDILNQFKNVRKNMLDAETGLYYHGFDESRSIFWADHKTGLSKNFWLRAIGWYLMGLVDTIEEMDRNLYDFMRPLQDIYKEALKGLLQYQDEKTGLFWQVVNRADLESEGNYLETSGSAMTAASILKACRLRLILREKYLPAAEKILCSLTSDKLIERGGRFVLTDTCSVAGLGPNEGRRDGTTTYYFSEPRVDDDNKGVAALFMAYAQYLMLDKRENI